MLNYNRQKGWTFVIPFVFYILAIDIAYTRELYHSNPVELDHYSGPGQIGKDQEIQQSCGNPSNGIYTFTLQTASPVGTISAFTVQYSSARKMPVAVAAFHDSLNHVIVCDRIDTFKKLPCSELSTGQTNCNYSFKMTTAQTEKSGYTAWDRGHLVPANPNRYHQQAMNTTFFCVNIAPQEPYTNQQSWRLIEDKSLDYFKTFSGLVITGTCPTNVKDGSTAEGYPVPACFWKLICYKDKGTGTHRVVGFYGNNSLILPTSSERAARTADVKKPRSQAEIIDLVGSQSYIEASWRQAGQLQTGRDLTPTPPNPTTCISTKTLPVDTGEEWGKIMYFDMDSIEDYKIIEQ